jgi:hypothetical protein
LIGVESGAYQKHWTHSAVVALSFRRAPNGYQYQGEPHLCLEKTGFEFFARLPLARPILHRRTKADSTAYRQHSPEQELTLAGWVVG